QLLLQARQGVNFGACNRCVLASRGAQRAGEMGERLGATPRRRRTQGKSLGLGPFAALEEIAGRNGGQGVVAGEGVLRVRGLGGRGLVQDTLGFAIAPLLQVSVCQVVERVGVLIPKRGEVLLLLEGVAGLSGPAV